MNRKKEINYRLSTGYSDRIEANQRRKEYFKERFLSLSTLSVENI